MDIHDPYRIPRPAVISFSGGRTSGYMLAHIVAAYGGTLPDDIAVVFANTGLEHLATLDFVDICSKAWGVDIAWVEYDWDAPHRTRIVDHRGASRGGEPYAALIDRKGFAPSVGIRFCTGSRYVELDITHIMYSPASHNVRDFTGEKLQAHPSAEESSVFAAAALRPSPNPGRSPKHAPPGSPASLGDGDWTGTALEDCSDHLRGLAPKRKRYFLWGQRTATTPGEWIELRIPHRIRYPVEGNPLHVMAVAEQWCDGVGEPHFLRLSDLEPAPETADA